jgi:hypothetical protein
MLQNGVAWAESLDLIEYCNKYFKNLRNSYKKLERCEEPENSTTQEGSIQAFPISGSGPVPSSAASGTTSSPVPIADKPTCE